MSPIKLECKKIGVNQKRALGSFLLVFGCVLFALWLVREKDAPPTYSVSGFSILHSFSYMQFVWLFVGGLTLVLMIYLYTRTTLRTNRHATNMHEEPSDILIGATAMGIFIVQDEILRYVDPTFERLFGYSPGFILETVELWDLIHPDDRYALARFLRREFSEQYDGKFLNVRGLRRSGEIIRCQICGQRISLYGRSAIIGTIRQSPPAISH